MLKPDVKSTLRAEDMPSDELRLIAQVIGVEAAIRLLDLFAGQTVYFAKHWSKNFVQKWVSQNWNGENVKQLSKDLGVSEMTIRRAVDKKKVRSNPLLPASRTTQQLDFFKQRGIG